MVRTMQHMNVSLNEQARADLATIRRATGLASDSAALRYALRQLAQQIENRRQPGGPG